MGQSSSGKTKVVSPVKFLQAAVIQYQRLSHGSMALRRVQQDTTVSDCSLLSPPKPLNVILTSACVQWGAVALKGTPTGTACSGSGLSWK